MKPWQTLSSVATKAGALELRKRGDAEFLISIAHRVLMTSVARHSEESLAKLGCEPVAKRKAPRVLIGGLGMGFTLRAALDALPRSAEVVVAELTPEVVQWCRGPLAGLTRSAIDDPRVQVALGDVSRLIANARPGHYDAILLDLYEGPHAATQRPSDPFYGRNALLRTRAALTPGGVFAVWSEDPDPPFAERLGECGFAVSRHREGQGGRTHFVYLGERIEERRAEPRGERFGGRGKSRSGLSGDPKAAKSAATSGATGGDGSRPFSPRRAAGSRTSRRESLRPT